MPQPIGSGSRAVPALVLGGPSHTTLSAIRALATAGIPQFAAGARSSFVARSRWYRPPPGGDEPAPSDLGGWLSASPLDRAVLFPCSDDWVAAVARLGQERSARFPVSMAPEASEICLDKGRLARTLADLGVPHPKTIALEPGDDAPSLLAMLRLPFIKPRDSLAFRARYGVKAFAASDPADARRRIQEAQAAGLSLVLQEFVPGPPAAHVMVDGFVDRHGTVSACFARRRIRTHPEPFGDSSCMVSIRPEEAHEPMASLARLLTAIHYRGIFSTEFKYDERDALFKLIEINARPWGGLSLPVTCGINVIEMAYLDALDEPVEHVTSYPAGRRWVYGLRDAAACWRLLRAGELTARDWIRSWRGAVQPVFTWDDPLPAAAELVQALWRRRTATGGAAPEPEPSRSPPPQAAKPPRSDAPRTR